MVQAIGRIEPNEIRLAQLLRDDYLGPSAIEPASPTVPAAPTQKVELGAGNMFEDVLAKSIEALNGVSQTEIKTNQLIDKYLHGEVELQDVMMAQSKMSIMVQLAVTTVNAAVTSFKEITQMQV